MSGRSLRGRPRSNNETILGRPRRDRPYMFVSCAHCEKGRVLGDLNILLPVRGR